MTDIALALPFRSRYGVSLPLAAGVFLYAAALLSWQRFLIDGDTYWHIAVGRWMIAHHQVPHADLFSNSLPGVAWVPHEWLAEIAIAGIFDHFGWTGLVVATALSSGLAMALLARALLRYVEPQHALIAVLGAWVLVVLHLLARPHMFALPLVVVWTAALVDARNDGRAPPLAFVPLMTLWANLHGGFLLGLVFGGFFAGEALIAAPTHRARWKALGGWGLFLVLALAAALITPNGIDGLLLPLKLNGMSFAMSAINEWQSPNFQHFQPLEIWILAGLCGAFRLGVRLPMTRIAMLLLLLHLALHHIRHSELVGLMVPLLIAPSLAATFARRSAGADALSLDRHFGELAGRSSPAARAVAVLVVALCALVLARVGIARSDDPVTPDTALHRAIENRVAGPVFNDYSFGGYLIYSGVAPFIDGRADMYGDDFLSRYFHAVGGVEDALPHLLDDYAITWTLLPPGSPAVTLLDHLPGWQRLYADKIAVVHRRVDAVGATR